MPFFCYGLILLCFIASHPLHATEIYQWTDEKGHSSFSDQPIDPTARAFEVKSNSNRYLYNVDRVSDGDTLVLENGERVRLLSINAPEVSSRYREAEPGGNQARDWLKQALKQGQVYLQYDTEKRDQYDRQLAYAWSTSGTFLNKQLLQNGLAVLTLQPPNLLHEAELIAAQQQAIQFKAGIWAEQHYFPRQISMLDETAYRGWRRWRLTPVSRSQTRKYWVLQVNEKVSLRIAKKHTPLFPPLENYLNRSLEVRGWISKRGNHYSLFVQHPSAITQLK